MIIARETLIRIAKETAQKQALSEPSLVAAYLTGSLLTEDPFLGGTTDIDIVFVHSSEPKVRCEIVPFTPEIHLDIKHRHRNEYDHPSELRIHPILGPELYDPLPLYVTKHFFEFVQAGVRDKYHDPVNVIARARQNMISARQQWSQLQLDQGFSPERLCLYLQALNFATNAIALLNGNPMAERRLMFQFPVFAKASGRPGLAVGLLGLLGGSRIDARSLPDLPLAWERDFTQATRKRKNEARLHPARLNYYKKAFEAFLGSEKPQTILWPLLYTWTLAATRIPKKAQTNWLAACEQLGLAGSSFKERLVGLASFLDTIDEILDAFAARNSL